MYHVSWEGAGDLNRVKFKVFSIWWGISASVMYVCSNRWKSRFNLSMVFINTPPSRLNWVFSFPGYIGPFWLKTKLAWANLAPILEPKESHVWAVLLCPRHVASTEYLICLNYIFISTSQNLMQWYVLCMYVCLRLNWAMHFRAYHSF